MQRNIICGSPYLGLYWLGFDLFFSLHISLYSPGSEGSSAVSFVDDATAANQGYLGDRRIMGITLSYNISGVSCAHAHNVDLGTSGMRAY